jgi:hypothetical protein
VPVARFDMKVARFGVPGPGPGSWELPGAGWEPRGWSWSPAGAWGRVLGPGSCPALAGSLGGGAGALPVPGRSPELDSARDLVFLLAISRRGAG